MLIIDNIDNCLACNFSCNMNNLQLRYDACCEKITLFGVEKWGYFTLLTAFLVT